MTIEYSDVIDARVDKALSRLYTVVPAKITSTSKLAEHNVVSAQPTIQKVLSDGFSYNMSLLEDVPVQWPAGGGAHMTFPLSKGDDVLVVFSMVSRAEWWLSDGISTPFDRRKHSQSDGFVIPCVFRKGNNPVINTDDVEISYNGGEIKIKKDSSVVLDNAGGSYTITSQGEHSGVTSSTWSMTNGTGELISLFLDCLQEISNTTVNTTYGTSPLNNKTAIDALITQLESFKE